MSNQEFDRDGYDTEKSDVIRRSINVLQKTLEKLDDRDYEVALIMLGVSIQMLSEVQTGLENHLTLEQKLRELIKR